MDSRRARHHHAAKGGNPMSETLSRDLLDRTASELVDALAGREVGALELSDAAIARIETSTGPARPPRPRTRPWRAASAARCSACR
jgi:hypothetical protein